jgi:hypothetical protein
VRPHKRDGGRFERAALFGHGIFRVADFYGAAMRLALE